MNLAGGAFPNARAGPEPLPALGIQGPPPALRPQEQSSPPPGPGASLWSGVGRPVLPVPKPPIMRPRPAGASRPAVPPPPARRPRLGDLRACPLCEVWPSWLPSSGKARRRDAAGPSPPPFSSLRNNGGPGRRGRGAGPRAASRCARGPEPGPAAAPPRRAPSPRAAPPPARRPCSPHFGPPPRCPSSFQTSPEKPPESRRQHGKLHFGGFGAGRPPPPGPRAGGGGGGAPAPPRTRGRRLPPARLSVSVTCPRSPPPPPPPSSPRPAGRWVWRRPCVSRGLPPGAPGRTRGCPRGVRTQLPGPARGTRGRERAHAGTQTHVDLKGARGAHAHKGTRTRNTGKGVQGVSRHIPTGGDVGTRRDTGVPATGPHEDVHRTELHT